MRNAPCCRHIAEGAALCPDNNLLLICRVGALFRHNIHRSHKRRGAIDAGGRTLENLDSLNVADVAGEVEGVVPRLRVADVDAVEQDGDLLLRAASDAHVRLGSDGSTLADIHACGVLQKVVNTLYWRRLNIVTRQYSYHSRCLTKCQGGA